MAERLKQVESTEKKKDAQSIQSKKSALLAKQDYLLHKRSLIKKDFPYLLKRLWFQKWNWMKILQIQHQRLL